MRTAAEIKTLIVNVAVADERIRAVLLSGSRANPNIKKDIFQDFDIIYIVKEMGTFLNDHSWIDIFGERIILQMPDEMTFEENKKNKNSFAYLMLFADNNRIDLTLYPLEKFENEFECDGPGMVWLDKDSLFSNFQQAKAGYLIKRPTQKMFSDCCNEFWWVCTYVAKGLWRKEIIYAKEMLEGPVRKMFLKVIEWHIGIETGFSVPFGKSGKNMQTYLPPALYERIVSTYPDAGAENIWKSVFAMCDIFGDLANKVSGSLSFEYNPDEEHNVKQYLSRVHLLAS